MENPALFDSKRKTKLICFLQVIQLPLHKLAHRTVNKGQFL